MALRQKRCFAAFLGTVEYERALRLQLGLSDLKKQGCGDDFLLLLEHPPTVTLGRNGRWEHLLASREILLQRGVGLHEIDRGGDITFHGPGQLVGYPLLKLEAGEQDVRRYMRLLEEVIVSLLAQFGVRAVRLEGKTGVWAEGGKIAALGVHISRWITRHGFALNVNTDLSFFELIVPCGIRDCRVTSMNLLLGTDVDLSRIARAAGERFGELFERELIWVAEKDLLDRLGRLAHADAVA